MLAKVRRIDFSPTEWLEGTIGLDNAARGLYITACALIYARGGPITYELLQSACNDHGLGLKRQFHLLISGGKLIENEGRITQERCENELRNARERSEKLSRNGTKGQEIKYLNKARLKPSRARNHQPSTINHQLEDSVSIETGADAPPDPVKEMWDLGVKVLGESSRSLIGRARKQHGDLIVMDAIIACQTAAPSCVVEYFQACLRRMGGTNGRRLSPAEGIYRGFADALAEREANRESGDQIVVPLLDRGGTGSA